jgi:hypothetical protein
MQPYRRGVALGALVAVGMAAAPSCKTSASGGAHGALPPPGSESELRSPGDFGGIGDDEERAAALFVEASRVLLHPRCVNCHVAGESPTQGAQAELHEPPLVRGENDDGVVGMYCGSCHADDNGALSSVPGAPGWKLPPASMAWLGKSPGAVCEQIRDPAQNGERDLEKIVEHSAHDALVAWGWSPGADREPPPGTQQQFAELISAWVEAGAACPKVSTDPARGDQP